MRRFEDAVVLIAGTARGMGRAAALRFSEEGASVVGADMDAEGGQETLDLIRSSGGEGAFVEADLADEGDVQRWVEVAAERYGEVNILYNNASAPKVALVDEMPLEDWDYILRNELSLVFLAIKHAVPHMGSGGTIINIGSVAGVPGIGTGMPGNAPGGAPHAATKGGVISMTRALAVELAPRNIRVVAISPGLIETPGTADLFDDQVLRKACERLTLLGRWGQPEDVVSTALFLASDEAGYITGTNVVVDGGWSAMGGGYPDVTWEQLTGKAGY